MGPQGEVTAVGVFPAKVTYLEQVLQSGDLFVYPTYNAVTTETTVCEALQRLQHKGIVLRAVAHIAQLGDLWHSGVALPSPERVSAAQAPEVTQRYGGVTMTYSAEISRANPSCLLTDGEATDDNRDPRPAAEAVRALSTMDGNVLLFNLHLSSHPGAPILYPESESGLPDAFARQLFQMSSLLPPHIREAAHSAGYTVGPQARGFVFNADIVEVIKFLDLGTRAELR